METNFETFTNAQEHNEEIRNSRVGGLGGSDADILLRVGRNGLSALTNTDLKRLAVMTGQAEADNWGGNAYTNAGHEFEDWIKINIVGNSAEREVKINADLARNFKTFAHADFFRPESKLVYECKFVQERDTDKVISRYYAQLQYYYLMGANSVKLIHGTGSAEPFNVSDIVVVPVERDDSAIDAILNGISLIDDFVSTFEYTNAGAEVGDLSQELQTLVLNCIQAKTEAEHYNKIYDEAKAEIEKYMRTNNLSNIDTATHVITIARNTTTRTFDTKKFLQAHAEFDTDEFYKVSEKKGAFSIKARK